jgi:hypothetical protein
MHRGNKRARLPLPADAASNFLLPLQRELVYFHLTMGTDQIRNLVSLVVEKHGIRAPSVAQYEALRARHGGDLPRAAEWREVARLAEAELACGVE